MLLRYFRYFQSEWYNGRTQDPKSEIAHNAFSTTINVYIVFEFSLMFSFPESTMLLRDSFIFPFHYVNKLLENIFHSTFAMQMCALNGGCCVLNHIPSSDRKSKLCSCVPISLLTDVHRFHHRSGYCASVRTFGWVSPSPSSSVLFFYLFWDF